MLKLALFLSSEATAAALVVSPLSRPSTRAFLSTHGPSLSVADLSDDECYLFDTDDGCVPARHTAPNLERKRTI